MRSRGHANPARRILFCGILLYFQLGLAYAARGPNAGVDIMQELRRDIKPKLDQTGKMAHYHRNFVRNDIHSETNPGEYTELIYNCSRPVDQFVSLDDKILGVMKVKCNPDSIIIETATPVHTRKLRSALRNSPTGLLYGGETWGCLSGK